MSTRTHNLPRVRIPGNRAAGMTSDALAAAGVRTVCQEAACPNRWECFGQRTATFLILGGICTRGCRFCNVAHGTPEPVNAGEPGEVADAVAALGLRHVVVTSVTRDDMADGGARHFASTIQAVRARVPESDIEVLTPDFQGDTAAIDTVLDARPTVFNHNIETNERLTPVLRRGAAYLRSLAVLGYAAHHAQAIPVKSGLMVGVGETSAELRRTLEDLRAVGCRMVTIGQYLAPSPRHYPVQEMVGDEQFNAYRSWALDLGFEAVAAGPLVRSSYHAAQNYQTLCAPEARESTRRHS